MKRAILCVAMVVMCGEVMAATNDADRVFITITNPYSDLVIGPAKVELYVYDTTGTFYIAETQSSNVIDHVSGERIRELCKDGSVCAVIGHVWLSAPMLMLTLQLQDDIERRTCAICGKVETKRAVWE